MTMTNSQTTWDVLIDAAWQAREHAYAPYSGFRVGAAVQCADGSIYGGCNIENVSYGLTNCAERTAMFQAVANGAKEFHRMVICADTEEPIAPCGACRQALAELCDEDFKVYVGINENNIKEFKLCELIPYSFDKSKLGD